MIGAVVVDALLARDEADRILAELGREAAVRLLGEHPQRPGVDAAAALLQHLERVVGLARVRRAEVGDDRLGLDAALRERDLDRALGARHRGVDAGGAGALVALRAARALRPAASLSASAGHGRRVAGGPGRQPEPVRLQPDCAGSLDAGGRNGPRRRWITRHASRIAGARPSGSGAASCRSRARRRRARPPSARAP